MTSLQNISPTRLSEPSALANGPIGPIGPILASGLGAMRRRLGLAGLTVALAVALGGCSALTSQNPSSSLKPVNAVEEGGDSRVILKGADLVAYFTQGKYVQGTAQFKTEYEGVTFRFSSAEHKALFDKEPKKYLPEFGGYCANGVAYGIPWGGDADTFKMMNGKLYIFGGQASKDGFEVDPVGNLALAEKYWKEEIAGNNSVIQRTKRLVFKVPHYKSGEDIAKEVAAAKAKKS